MSKEMIWATVVMCNTFVLGLSIELMIGLMTTNILPVGERRRFWVAFALVGLLAASLAVVGALELCGLSTFLGASDG